MTIHQLLDKAWLEEEYFTKTDREIAADLGCSDRTVCDARKRLGIQARVREHKGALPDYLGAEELLRRLFARTKPQGDCWEWIGPRHIFGYGKITRHGKNVAVHRFVWALLHGQIPPRMCICHHCDNPPCIRPAHLFLGTFADNNADIARKGRTTRGERNVNAKMSASHVRVMRILHAQGIPQQVLANHFAVTQSAISNITLGHTWKHVDDILSTAEQQMVADLRILLSHPRVSTITPLQRPPQPRRKLPLTYQARRVGAFSWKAPRDSIMAHFLTCLDMTGTCWLWLGSRDIGGYGRLQCDRKTIKAHRFSYVLHYGDIPDDMLICHACDTRACVRPTHLFLGSEAENMTDMVHKGRSLRGAKNPQARFSDETIQLIRRLYASGHYTQQQLGEMFHLHQASISQIVLRKSWQHVATP